jgi:hypothetical protein
VSESNYKSPNCESEAKLRTFSCESHDQFSGCVNDQSRRRQRVIQGEIIHQLTTYRHGKIFFASPTQNQFLGTPEGRILHEHEQLARRTPHRGQERRHQVRTLPGVSLGPLGV